MLALRVSAIGLAVLACFGVALPVPTLSRTVVVLLDVSDSVPRERVEASRAASLSLIRSLKARDRAAAAIFAGGTVTLCPPVEADQAATILESADLTLDSSVNHRHSARARDGAAPRHEGRVPRRSTFSATAGPTRALARLLFRSERSARDDPRTRCPSAGRHPRSPRSVSQSPAS
jgi:hypothetical protein